MTFTLKEKLIEKCLMPLPGKKSQEAMLPSGRTLDNIIPHNAIQSAVMVIIQKTNTHYNTILIERNQYDGVHSGQISFPGGKKEDYDKSHVDTAIRECYEETNIKINENEIITTLTPVYIPPSNFMVYPILCYTEKNYKIIKSEREVNNVLIRDLNLLFDKKSKSTKKIKTSYAELIETPVYLLNDKQYIWGATALILAELEQIWNEIK